MPNARHYTHELLTRLSTPKAHAHHSVTYTSARCSAHKQERAARALFAAAQEHTNTRRTVTTIHDPDENDACVSSSSEIPHHSTQCPSHDGTLPTLVHFDAGSFRCSTRASPQERRPRLTQPRYRSAQGSWPMGLKAAAPPPLLDTGASNSRAAALQLLQTASTTPSCRLLHPCSTAAPPPPPHLPTAPLSRRLSCRPSPATCPARPCRAAAPGSRGC